MSIVDLEPAAQRLADLVESIDEAELSLPTPCAAYTVGDLISHVSGFAQAFTAAAAKAAALRREGGPAGNASALPADWQTRVPRELLGLAQAWSQASAWNGLTRIAGSEAPAELVGLSAADELVVHGWDVARATGQPYAVEPELLQAAGSFLTRFATPDAPSGPTVPFGPSREVPDGAPLLDRVVALSGRDPGWQPA